MIKLKFIAVKALWTFLLLIFLLFSPLQHAAELAILTPSQMSQDLEYVADLIRRVHPDPFHAGSEEGFNALVSELSKKITSPMSRTEFYFILNQLTNYAQDAHTTFYYTYEQYFLPVIFYWADDGLMITNAQEGCELRFGDKILSIGGMNPSHLLLELNKIIASENIYWVKARSSEFLSHASLLRNLNLVIDNRVEFVIENIKGKVKTIWIEIERDQLPPDTRGLCGWEIDQEHSLGYFYLDRCRNTYQYKDSLEKFFREVKERRITRIAVDLRYNPGGTSSVLEEFLKFLPVGRGGGWFNYIFPSDVEGYGYDIRYSPEAAEQKGYSQTSGFFEYNPLFRLMGYYRISVAPPPSPDLVFFGEVYILTSYSTFSSANLFAVVTQDNGLALLVGESTGNMPSSFGDTLSFITPHSNFNFTISHKKFYRSDSSKDPADACYPDIYIPTTVKDIRQGRDPQMEYLRSLFSY